MRHLGIVASSVPSVLVPTIVINTTTNYNQNRATFNATVTTNGGDTDVQFQYSTNGSTWTNGGQVGVSNITGPYDFYYNQTGLSENTLYYVRAVATNSAGTSTSSSTTFTTWHLIDFWSDQNTSITIPTITPTGATTIIPSIYEVCIVGGGGGANGGGGGGGRVRIYDSVAFNSSTDRQINLNIGGGGAAGSAGGTSSISGNSFTTISANGGATGSGYDGGGSGKIINGTSTDYAGGTGYFATDGAAKNPMTATGYGGGAGSTAVGGNGSLNFGPPSYAYGYGGNGGAGYPHSRWSSGHGGNFGGGGGGGYYATTGGGNGSSATGVYGLGGSCLGISSSAGNGGAIFFRYYAAS